MQIADVLSHLSNIEILDLSWLINVTDISLLAVGSKCVKLQKFLLTGCEAISAEGLRAFSGHQTLKRLMLFSCYNFCWEDVESVALTCTKLEYLKRIKMPTPEFSFDYSLHNQNLHESHV
ncbi:putative leucine-rich repeat domain superfamily [Helianthus annuus]|nr:putative leucine-rich repeat domain superfamily [Helianthus annuus]